MATITQDLQECSALVRSLPGVSLTGNFVSLATADGARLVHVLDAAVARIAQLDAQLAVATEGLTVAYMAGAESNAAYIRELEDSVGELDALRAKIAVTDGGARE